MQTIFLPENKTFDIGQTLNCGQVFRFHKIENGYKVYSLNKCAEIVDVENGCLLCSDDCNYFFNYLDFDTDYEKIQKQCNDGGFVSSAIEFGRGIHILKQDITETIISFIISQNNHIPRIKMIIERICQKLGQEMNGYFAFPTLEKLAGAGEQFYSEIGAGYRAAYLDRVSKYLLDVDLEEWKKLDTSALRAKLMALYGVGRKVADCILLFGFNRFDVFPVDTWILKVFENEYQGFQAEALSKLLVKKYGEYSGFVQQWLFFCKREAKNVD